MMTGVKSSGERVVNLGDFSSSANRFNIWCILFSSVKGKKNYVLEWDMKHTDWARCEARILLFYSASVQFRLLRNVRARRKRKRVYSSTTSGQWMCAGGRSWTQYFSGRKTPNLLTSACLYAFACMYAFLCVCVCGIRGKKAKSTIDKYYIFHLPKKARCRLTTGDDHYFPISSVPVRVVNFVECSIFIFF
jgi:hypothetical protein